MSESFSFVKFVISLAVFMGTISIGIVLAVVMHALSPEVPKADPPSTLRSVAVMKVTNDDVRTDVVTNGVVEAHTETQIVTEVTGRIVMVSPRFESGEIVDEGEVLLEIDPSIYRANVASARAEVASAKAALDRELAESDVAKAEWEKFGNGEASDLVLRKPQLAQARARVEAAEAALDRAEVDLDRTTVRAPFTGRFRECLVDVGQYVTAGTRTATLYAIDFAEVRIPIPVNDLAFLDVPLDASMIDKEDAPVVVLSARIGRETHFWTGRIARTEGRIDARTRTISALVRVDDPYGRETKIDHPPLLLGTFVEATIRGRVEKNVAAIPRSVLREGSIVPVVTLSTSRAAVNPPGGSTSVSASRGDVAHAEDTDGSDTEATATSGGETTGIVDLRRVEVVRLEPNNALVRGLETGELVATTPLDVAVDGMSVGIVPSEGVDMSPVSLAGEED